MRKRTEIRCLFLDVGGVLMTNGWDHGARDRAAAVFGLDRADLEERHHQVFDAYEQGKLDLDAYLDASVFHRRRDFSRARFRAFLFAQSKAYPDMLALVAHLKARHRLKVAIVSNEGRELNAHRIKLAGLGALADAFVSSSYVHLRKPDPDIFRLALDLVQVAARKVLYIENTPLHLKAAAGLGIRGILHRDFVSTRTALAEFGLK